MPQQVPDMKMRILLAAKRLFAVQGYDATSVRQICEEAGANVALISYHFGGKENVFYAIFEQFFPRDRLQLFNEELADPLWGIRQIIQEIILLRDRDPDLIHILQMEIILHSPRIEVIQPLALPIWQKVSEMLEDGRAKGDFHFDSLDNTLLFMLGAVFFYKQRTFFEPIFTEEKPGVDKLIEQTTRFVMNGLGVQENETKR
jgi:AcrR family transcriptional regulator